MYSEKSNENFSFLQKNNSVILHFTEEKQITPWMQHLPAQQQDYRRIFREKLVPG